MRWRWSGTMNLTNIFLAILLVGFANSAEGSRRAQRRKDSKNDLYIPAPSAESIQALAEAMGAAGFESYTEGKALVKRLIPSHSQPDLDIVEHQGVIGKAGIDFPALPNIPNTGFNCKNVPTGYYADLETDCQVFHICDTSRKISFLCPNGTIFSQSHLICDWWFKVDCASSPALYESSVEYYSNEQKKSQKVTKSLSKNADLQQIGETNVRAESRRASVNVPSTTERLIRHRQRLSNESPNIHTTKPSSRSYQALFNINPTQRAQATATFENKRRNLVQLISNDFGNGAVRSTLPTFYDASTHRTTIPAGDYNSIREMQEAAETASFAQNQNRQFLRDYNNKNLRPYPVYSPNLPPQSVKTKSNPSLTTLYDIKPQNGAQYTQEATTKRHTLIPYTKSYVNTINENREPYTRPGVSLLKSFIEKEKNRTVYATTEKIVKATARSGDANNISWNTAPERNQETFESSTKIPHTTRDARITASTNRFETYSTIVDALSTTEQPYQERKQRLLNKNNYDISDHTEPTLTTVSEKYYGDQPNRPGLVIPPSLTPKTLHSLAIYYATAMDNLSTEKPQEDNELTTPAFDDFETMEDGLPNIFSQQTINKYSSLFGHGSNNDELLEEIKLDPNGTYNEIMEDLSFQMSQMPLATSPQIRELAQVFTHALSAYLQDPVQFRKVLSDIRPTPPSFGDMLTATDDPTNTEPTTTINEDDDEILGFSDDHKIRDPSNSIRDPKALKIATDYTFETTTTQKPTTMPIYSTTYVPTTPTNPFRCCGRISASYTTAQTPTIPFYSPSTRSPKSYERPTTDSYTLSQYGELKNNSDNDSEKPYGYGLIPTGARTISDYTEVTNLPSAWDDDVTDSTLQPITNSHQMFESKKIRTTFPEPRPTYVADADSVELENEEELQRAHSQSFVSPQGNSVRQEKQLEVHNKNFVKQPSFDLEAPTIPDIDTTTIQATTQSFTTTVKDQTEAYTTTAPVSSSVFTSPGAEKTTYEFQWPTTFDNWQSTIIDPITLNDGLSVYSRDQSVSKLNQQTDNEVSTTFAPTTTYYTTTEQVPSSTIRTEVTTSNDLGSHREGKALREPTSTEISQDLTTIADTVVEKAKEIMGGMNSTTTQKLMNVMKKTKSKTVKRLILLLVQTCDDDHNSTAEASKKALLEALMAVSQKDMEDIAKEEATETTIPDIDYIQTTQFQRRMDRIPIGNRSGKSLNIDAKAVNSLSNPTTAESQTKSETTTANIIRTTFPTRRGARKFQARTTPETRAILADRPIAEARIAAQDKTQSDTRAIELLRSLYTIAAKWG
ncbi:unnamed protein product [Pieris macdunnoughi]|uniref:Chitin-binding type-2 domain-containing protein n=1 Tax=Pieris macdunnoughi TaxID=345717 RepID=A0A821RF04_9NEOP|nr:unnamed protein product [Pieris macdunnoughi]